MTDTKRLAFESIQHDLQRRELEVLGVIAQLVNPTCRMIARHLDFDCCQVTGRLDKLVEKGLIEQKGHRTNPGSGKLANCYEVTTEGWEHLRSKAA